MGLKETILAAVDGNSETVTVPDWGVNVVIKSLSGKERDRWEKTIVQADGKVNLENIRAKLLSVCLVDDEGKPIFTEQAADALGDKSAVVLDRLFTISKKINAIGEAEITELKKS